MIKHLHMLLAVLTVLFFSVRVVLRLKQSMLLQNKFMRIAPHVVDSLLLFFGILLALSWGNVLENPWIIAKIIAVGFYIGLGFYTLKKAKSNVQVLLGALCSWLLLLYIFVTAFTKNVFFL